MKKRPNWQIKLTLRASRPPLSRSCKSKRLNRKLILTTRASPSSLRLRAASRAKKRCLKRSRGVFRLKSNMTTTKPPRMAVMSALQIQTQKPNLCPRSPQMSLSLPLTRMSWKMKKRLRRRRSPSRIKSLNQLSCHRLQSLQSQSNKCAFS